MNIIDQQVVLDDPLDGGGSLRRIESAARTCWKSEWKNKDNNPDLRDALIRSCIAKGHESVLEHVQLTFRAITNRGVLAEWTRHRIASYSVESTRFCNYKDGITVIAPWYLKQYDLPLKWHDTRDLSSPQEIINRWVSAMEECEYAYGKLLSLGCRPQEARGVLPLDLAVEMVCSMNLRSLRNFFRQRCAPTAHPQIKEIADAMLTICKGKFPPVFGDING